MSDLYILASIPNQGKTTTAILLEKMLKSEGKRVACLQAIKGKYDVHRYLCENCFHYSIPLEATKSREQFEQWLPEGYDAFILEITYGIHASAATYIDLFNNINEIVSTELSVDWKRHVANHMTEIRDRCWDSPEITKIDPMWHWNRIHAKNVIRVLTKTSGPVDGPCIDTTKQFYNPERLAREEVTPRMKLPKDRKKRVIAVGSFPAEYWDIYPNLKWFRFDFAGFMDALRRKQYDLAVIGAAGSDAMKLSMRSDHGSVVCYQPTMYLDIPRRKANPSLLTDFPTMFSRIKHAPVGTPLVEDGALFSAYNNRYWVYDWYDSKEPVWKDGNMVFCTGWVLPQYLIRDGFLEVN